MKKSLFHRMEDASRQPVPYEGLLKEGSVFHSERTCNEEGGEEVNRIDKWLSLVPKSKTRVALDL